MNPNNRPPISTGSTASTVFTFRRIAVGAALLLCAGLAIKYLDLIQAAATPNPIASSAESISHGQRLWLQDCAACHGAQGRGDGPVTASLPKRPKDLTRVAKPPIFPDGVIAYRIANGVDVMPAWKSVLSQEDIWDIVNFIRAQGQ